MTDQNDEDALNPTIDLDRLRLSQNFADLVGVKKQLLVVQIRKPDKQWFIRVRPEPEWSFTTATLTVKEERGSETFIVDRALWEFLHGELVPTLLVVGISRQNVLFMWPLRLPGADGRFDTWARSALGAADLAKKQWIRVAANMHAQMYDTFSASADLPEPEWPDVSFQRVIDLALQGRFIRSADHPVLRKLRGEI
jgi:hypothetical protein